MMMNKATQNKADANKTLWLSLLMAGTFLWVTIMAIAAVKDLPVAPMFWQGGLALGGLALLFAFRDKLGAALTTLRSRPPRPAHPSVPETHAPPVVNPPADVLYEITVGMQTIRKTGEQLAENYPALLAMAKTAQVERDAACKTAGQATHDLAHEKVRSDTYRQQRDEHADTIKRMTIAQREATDSNALLKLRVTELEGAQATTPKTTTTQHALDFARFVHEEGRNANYPKWRDAIRAAGYVIKGEEVAQVQAAVASFRSDLLERPSLPSLPSVPPSAATPSPITPAPLPSVSVTPTDSVTRTETVAGEGVTDGNPSRKAARKLPRKARNGTRKVN